MLRLSSRVAIPSSRPLSTQAQVGQWVEKLNAANRADEVKDVLTGVKQAYPSANIAFRKELPKRPAPEPLAPGLIEQYSLNLPSRYIPLATAGFLFLTSNGFMVLNEEWMLGYVFCAYAGMAYGKLRKPAMEMLEANNKALLETFNKAENKKIDALKISQEEEKEKSLLFREITAIPETKQALTELEAFNEVEKSKLELRNKVAKSLEAVALIQDRLSAEASRDLIAKANAAVLKELGSEAAKKKMFEAALSTLKTPDAPPKNSPVLDSFTAYFNKTAKENAGKPASLHPEVKAKMEEVLSAVGLKATDASMTKFSKA